MSGFSLYAQIALKGQILDELGKALDGASIRVQSTGKVVRSDKEGHFSIVHSKSDSIDFSAIGYRTQVRAVYGQSNSTLIITMLRDSKTIEEVQVMSTGYYQLPKERLTGSFEYVGEKELQRSTSPNILERLEGLVNGLQFDRSGQTREDASGFSFRVRGLSTIEADKVPLIVWDGFPYEGDIKNISPDNIESVTVLKDAAASSIWGARAGNGVIVITSKNSVQKKVSLAYRGSVTSHSRPDLFYNPNWIESTSVLALQKQLFEKGHYAEQDQLQLPEYVELLIKQREGTITEGEFATQESWLMGQDFRRDASTYLYQNQFNQQHNLSFSGGGDKYRFFLSGFYQGDRSAIVGDENRKFGLNNNSQFNLFKGNELSINFNYTTDRGFHNSLNFNELGNLSSGADVYSYLRTADGTPAKLSKQGIRTAFTDQAQDQGYRDWSYRPLADRDLMDNTSNANALLLQLGLKQQLLPYWAVELRYQYGTSQSEAQQIHDAESYYVRDLINRFMGLGPGKSVIPDGAIFNMSPTVRSTQERLRLQTDFNNTFSWGGTLNLLAGMEMAKTERWQNPGSIVYGYDKELWTGHVNLDFSDWYTVWGDRAMLLPTPVVSRIASSGRDLSYYGNMAYSHRNRYILSGSLRWDGSNLFGVKTNQKGVPLWSIGAAWNLSEESFFSSIKDVYLKLRATYGISGNMDRSQSSYPTISYLTNTLTNRPSASLSHPGNPNLRWEEVAMANIGLDWKYGSLSGTVEPYWKKSSDLLGKILMDPTTGTSIFSNFKVNYADMVTRGLDVKVNAALLKGDLNWNVSALYSYVSNRVGNFVNNTVLTANAYLSTRRVPTEGKSLDALYALPWNGLSSVDGLPVVYINGQESRDYRNYFQKYDPTQLLGVGVTVAPNFLRLQNQFRFKGFSLGAIVASRWGHVFRRSSMYPGSELIYPGPGYHRDYSDRWQKPGDEQITIVPAAVDKVDLNLINTTKYSEALIEKADVIKLQQINLAYDLADKWAAKAGLVNCSLFANLNNVGILWRANRLGLDPDFPRADYPAPFHFSLGLRLQL